MPNKFRRLGNAFFREEGGTLTGVTDPQRLRRLEVGEIQAPEAPIAAPGSSRFGVPSAPQQAAPQAAPQQAQDPTDSFNVALMGLLKKSQGVDNTELLKRRRALQRAAIGRAQEVTPEELRTLSPAQQAAIRGGDVAALEPELDKVNADIAQFEQKTANFERFFDEAQKLGEEFAAKVVPPDDVLDSYARLIEAGQPMSTVLAGVNDKVRQEVIKRIDFTQVKDEAKELDIKAKQLRNEGLELDNRKKRDELGGGTPSIGGLAETEVDVPTFDEFIAQKEEELQMTLIPSAREELRAEYQADIHKAERESLEKRIDALDPFTREVYKNPKNFFNLTNTEKGGVIRDLAEAGIDTAQLQEGKKNKFSATQADDIVQARIAREGALKLKSMLGGMTTGPVVGRLKSLNPYDTEYLAVKADIDRLVPGLARGVFKEVGVLTDTDIDRYTRTLANPNATWEQIQRLHQDTMDKIDKSLRLITETYEKLGYDLRDFTIEDAIPGDEETTARNAAIGDTVTIGGEKFRKIGDDNFEPL